MYFCRNKQQKGSEIKRLAFFKTVLGSKTQQIVETYVKSELTEQIYDVGKIQNGDTRKYKKFVANRQMSNAIDFKDAYFHSPIKPQSRKYLGFHVQGQFKAVSFGLSRARMDSQWKSRKLK